VQRRPFSLHPTQVVVLGFIGVTVVGTLLLMLPFASTDGASPVEAFFTATSAVCVTGHIVVDTSQHWTPAGHVIIAVLAQIGGLGVMSIATLLGLLVARRLGLRSRMNTANETHSLNPGDVRAVIFGVFLTTAIVEAVVTLALTIRFALEYRMSFGEALGTGAFHAVAAYTNAGFSTFSNSLMDYVGDPFIILPVAAAIIIGGIGFPVILELWRRYKVPVMWSMHTKLVLSSTVVLLLGGWFVLTAIEWSNPATLGPLDWPTKLLAGFFASVTPRSGGFNSIDVGQMDSASWLVTDVLMFIGGGPAGTAGGLKVTTFSALLFVVWTEIRGEGAVHIFGKRLSSAVIREATAVALLAVAAVMGSTIAIMMMTHIDLDRILFEVISAFATVGLSTGITADLPIAAQLILCVLMFLGRLGPIALASSLALKRTTRLYEYPEERPIIG
jgi:trk system potassium uptake protein TrkH